MCPICASETKQKMSGKDLPAKLAAPALRALDREGIKSLAQLAKRSEAELMELHGMGPKALGQLKEAMRAARLSFR